MSFPRKVLINIKYEELGIVYLFQYIIFYNNLPCDGLWLVKFFALDWKLFVLFS